MRRTEGTQRAQRTQIRDTEKRGNGRDRDRDAVRTRIGRDRDRPERNSGAGEAKVLTAMGTAGARENVETEPGTWSDLESGSKQHARTVATVDSRTTPLVRLHNQLGSHDCAPS